MILSRTPERRTDSADRSRWFHRDHRLRCVLLVRAMVLTMLWVLPGCRSVSRDGETGMLDVSDMVSIDAIRGPLERVLSDEESPLEMGRRFTPEERREVDQCRISFEQGQYEDAIKRCKKAAKRHKESSLGEEAQFYLAESYFALGQYAKAQDGFDQLFEDYPSTRYVEPSTRRLFAIARAWLEISDPAATNEIRQVSGEKVLDDGAPPQPSADPTVRVRVLPNFHDSTRPIFDTPGRALECLKSIWMNDPTGPLADDALMLTATYYQRHNNYVEADRYYEILREEYPDSRHLEEAFLLGSHVKQMSYQGAYYEGRELEGARRLKEQSLQLFPASQQRQQLRKDLSRLYLLEAERAWSRIEYYQKKRKPRSVAIACVQLLSDYPDTPFAEDARRILSTVDRRELQDLPEISEFLESLPASAPPPREDAPEGGLFRKGPPVKSVSDPRPAGQPEGRASLQAPAGT
jgi:outer membrane protein assembly factor BamD (BamD/ComL family)